MTAHADQWHGSYGEPWGADAVLLPGHCLTLSNKDSVAALSELPEGCVQLVVTSPPYDDLRSYGGHSWDFEGTARELYRVMCDGGIVCWNVGDSVVDGSETLTSMRQAIHFKDVSGFRVHDTMIYEKSNGSKPNPTRYNQVMEYIFVLSKGRPRTFNPIEDKRNVTFGKSVFGLHTLRERDGTMTVRKPKLIAAEYGRRGNVWKGNTRGQEEVCKALPHPAMMPKWLARDLILSWSNPGDLVADPFAGSFTTCAEALKLGRRTWGSDISPEYVRIGEQLCNNTTIGFALG